MTVNGSSTPKDVETMLQMNYLYFTNIKKDTDAFNNLISSYEIELKNRELSPDIAFGDSATATFYGHNPRLKPMLLEDVKNIDYDRILQIAKERTANAAGWTFTIIGNYDEATIRPLICQYIASLPAKGKVVNGKRTAFLEKGIVDNTFTRKMETPKAKFQYMWYNEDMPYSLENVIRADIGRGTTIDDASMRTKAIQAAMSGDLARAKMEIQRTGLLAQNYCRGWFTDKDNGWAPNSPRTVAMKGSANPLIDTGALRKAIIYVTRSD